MEKELDQMNSSEKTDTGRRIVNKVIMLWCVYLGVLFLLLPVMQGIVLATSPFYLGLVAAQPLLLYGGRRLARLSMAVSFLLAPLIELALLPVQASNSVFSILVDISFGLIWVVCGIILLSSHSVSVFMEQQKEKYSGYLTCDNQTDTSLSFLYRLRRLNQWFFGGA